MVVCLSFSTPSFGGYTPVFLNPDLIASGVIAAVYAGTSTQKNVTLDILWPHMSLFTCINCLWYSALNKAKEYCLTAGECVRSVVENNTLQHSLTSCIP